MRILAALLLVIASVCALSPTAAQPTPSHPRQVFLQRDTDSDGQDTLVFVDVLTGEETTVEVYGEHYTPIPGAILYVDTQTRRVKLALPDGSTREHSVIQPEATTRRIDWVLSPDRQRIAWTLTEGSPNALTTTTWIAAIDGENARQILVDGARDGIRATPVAFSLDGEALYMDYQPDLIGDFTPFRQYAGLFRLDLITGQTAMLPGEPGCFCGAGIGAGMFLRLSLTPDLTGYDARIYPLPVTTPTTIPALTFVGYTQSGDVLIAPDGRRAIYALAQVRDFGAPNQSVRTIFVLVDLDARTQRPLTDPITTFVRPVAWTEDDSAILLTSPTRDGTWKVKLSDGTLVKVADATYIGTL